MGVRTDLEPRLPIFAGVKSLLRKDLAVFVPRDRFLVGFFYLLAHPTVLPNEEAFFWLGIALAGTCGLCAHHGVASGVGSNVEQLACPSRDHRSVPIFVIDPGLWLCGNSVDLHRTPPGPDPESAAGKWGSGVGDLDHF